MGRSMLTYAPEISMTREEYYAWAEQQSRGRFERHQGIVVAGRRSGWGTTCANRQPSMSCSVACVPPHCPARHSRTA